MIAIRSLLVLVLASFFLIGCENLKLVQSPTVKLTDVTLLSSSAVSQRFQLTLLVSNPNPVSFKAQGLRYDIAIGGVDLFAGETAALPKFKAYGAESITINVDTNLLGAFQLIQRWINAPNNSLDYRLNGALTINDALGPMQFSQSGSVSLTR